MSLLSNADLSKVLEAIALLNSGVDLASLPERSLACVNSLIPNEFAVFDGFDSGAYSGYYWHSHHPSISPGWLERLAEVLVEHPAYETVLMGKAERTFRISDLVSLSEFYNTNLYNDVYKNVCGDTQLATAMAVSPNVFVTHSMYRDKLDFTETDREKLRLVAPHLKAAFANAFHFESVEQERRYLSEVASKGMMAVGADGKVIFQSRLAQEFLQKYFDHFGPDGIPVEIKEYVKAECAAASAKEFRDPAEPLIITSGGEELKITVTFDTREREVLIFLEERRPHTVNDFERAGVTHREAEILYWIGRGKTDPEIALLLSISPRTVQKHVEHIFTKMGVETRTAAVMRALDAVER